MVGEEEDHLLVLRLECGVPDACIGDGAHLVQSLNHPHHCTIPRRRKEEERKDVETYISI